MTAVVVVLKVVREPLVVAVLGLVVGYALYQRWFWGQTLAGEPTSFWDLVVELVFSPYLVGFVLLPAWTVFAVSRGRAWLRAAWLVRAGSRLAAVLRTTFDGVRIFLIVSLTATTLIAICSVGSALVATAAPNTVTSALREDGVTPVFALLGQATLYLVFFAFAMVTVAAVTFIGGKTPAAIVGGMVCLWVILSGADLLPRIGGLNARAVLDLRNVLESPGNAMIGFTVVAVLVALLLLGVTLIDRRRGVA
ncbi:MAG: hypothetical protein ABI435_02840 [Pseudolysinimonas sp.]